MWTAHEFRAIAEIQAWYEDTLAQQANRVLFCDTDLFATAVWQQRLMGETSAEIVAQAKRRRYDLYVVPDLDTPFAQDEWTLRDDGPHRVHMQRAFLDHARSTGAPIVEPTGSRFERVEQVAEAVEALVTDCY